ncbi:hypothetical protein ABK040_014696 [Willaertia magna]
MSTTGENIISEISFEKQKTLSNNMNQHSKKCFSCPCLNTQISLQSTLSTTIVNNQTKQDSESNLLSDILSKESFENLQQTLSTFSLNNNLINNMKFINGNSMVGIESKLQFFLKTIYLKEIKLYICSNCDTFCGFSFINNNQLFHININDMINEQQQLELKQSPNYSNIFEMIPMKPPTSSSSSNNNNLNKHPVLLEYQKLMQRKLNEEKLRMENRIKEFTTNQKLAFQKYLTKSQNEKDILFGRVKFVLLEGGKVKQQNDDNKVEEKKLTKLQISSQDLIIDSTSENDKTPTPTLSPLTSVTTANNNTNTISNDLSIVSNNTVTTTVEQNNEVVKKPRKRSQNVKISENKEKKEEKKKEKKKKNDNSDLFSKSLHYRQMTQVSKSYTPNAFFNFDEESLDESEEESGNEEEEADEQDNTLENNNQISNVINSAINRRFDFNNNDKTLNNNIINTRLGNNQQLYSSSVPISIPLLEARKENNDRSNQLPLYFDKSNKENVVPVRRERTKSSFMNKPRLDDDIFTEASSYIDKYMSFRNEYIEKVESMDEKEVPEPNGNDEDDDIQQQDNELIGKKENHKTEEYDDLDYLDDDLEF